MVRIIRMFRPLVIYSRWGGTPADGHGQHQFAGALTPLAFKAAASPHEFPDQLKEGLRPWEARKLYRGIGFGANAANTATLQVQTGIFDPVLGRTYNAIAGEGRSQHKSQEQGGTEMLGPASSSVRLVESLANPGAGEQSLFDGIDVTLPGLATLAGLREGALRTDLQAMNAAVRKAIDGYQPLDPAVIVPALAAGLSATRAARVAATNADGSPDARAEADFLLSIKEQDFIDALTRAAGVIVDPLSDTETMIPGGEIGVSVRTFVAQGSPATVVSANLVAPAGWQVSQATTEIPLPIFGGPGTRREMPTHEARYRVRVPSTAPITQPYHLEQPRQGDGYRWPETAPKGLPFNAPLLNAAVKMEIGGVTVDVARPVEYRVADRVRGELRREVNIVPAVAVGLDSKLLIVPRGTTTHQQRLVVRATSFSPQSVSGTLRLRLPAGWTSSPADAPFTLKAAGEKTSTPFVVTAPARRTSGAFDVVAEAVVAGTMYGRDVQEVAYPHIQTHRLYWPASATAQVFDLKVAPVKVGYVMGSGDQVPDALRRMGVDVTLLDDETLATGDLSRFDTIVVGVRASEARPAFVANNGRLLQYIERGGTLLVQYQQSEYYARGLPPYPAAAPMNSRVTDENAPVKILVPMHPAFTFPNRITDADFNGWVQERNLYAFNTFDRRYVPLLESADPGEAPQVGGEVYAEVGKGRYVYTSYAWFRQLPAGVPGAYRQFANLISLSKAPR
jgi:hypothetical protein